MKFIETICFKNGEYQNLDLHQERINRTCFHFFGESLHKLSEALPEIDDDRKHKVRFVYDIEEQSHEQVLYVQLPIRSLQIVESNWFDYSFKYENRSTIEKLLKSAETDDIIISIDGLVTDCSYANLAFWNGEEWLTPEKPLLEGVKRATLLKSGKVKKASIPVDQLYSFEKVSLINAMLDLGELEVPIDSITSGPSAP
ncbi:MAG: aminotransferase class IV [Cyclobacteriaceae bacterium]